MSKRTKNSEYPYRCSYIDKKTGKKCGRDCLRKVCSTHDRNREKACRLEAKRRAFTNSYYHFIEGFDRMLVQFEDMRSLIMSALSKTVP